MIKITIAAVFAALAFVGILPGAAVAANCNGRHYVADYDYMTEFLLDGNDNDPTWRVMHEMKFRNCAGRGATRWADPIWLKVGCREHDGPVNIAGQLETRFNPRIWDRDGHEVNPGVWDVECNSSQWDTEKHYFRGTNKFHLCYNGGPRVDTSVEIEIFADTNPTSRLSNAWWGYTGPVRRTC